MKLYERLARQMSEQIHAGVLRPGARMPSVRGASRGHRVSPATVRQAYRLLEDRGEVQARPKSGHYVSMNWAGLPRQVEKSAPSVRTTRVDVSELVFEILESVKSDAVVPLGSAFISPTAFPLNRLARSLGSAARRLSPHRMLADLPPGNLQLRRIIARRYLDSGVKVAADEVVITSGALEALNLCLQAVTRPGGVVAIEDPTFYSALQAIERLGLRAVSVPTHPRDGIDLNAFADTLDRHPVQACWLMPTFQNPVGSLMPEDRKQALVELLAAREIPLIEDDVYAELYFGSVKPRPAKAFDKKGLVLHCSSFSKCLAPGYRLGWCAAGRYSAAIDRVKLTTTLATSIPVQAGIADFLVHGGYERHLRRLRRALEIQQTQMVQAIRRHFPQGTRVSRPQGGYFLWVELPPSVNSLDVQRVAMSKGISVAPGPMFSPTRGYTHFVRISSGHPWTPQLEASVATLGRIVDGLS
jgi:DNA-binding transcriptional MocR family regulator